MTPYQAARVEFYTNHACVLSYFRAHPTSTVRVAALSLRITERTVHKILSELEVAGYVTRKRVGRGSSYKTKPMPKLLEENS